MSLARVVTALVTPPRCAACGGWGAARQPLCEACAAAMIESRPIVEGRHAGLDGAVAATELDGVARLVVHGLKYGRRLALARVAAEAITRACPAAELHGTLVPVPAAPLRRAWRGFDPAEELALSLARLGGLGYSDCLRRSDGPRQVGRSRTARLADPPRMRAVGPAPGRVLLVDDVRTTGATLASSAAALRGAGTKEVVALTFARRRPC